MEGAIFRGIYNTTSTMPFTCSTNCTWEGPDYISLGVRSNCDNVTSATLDTKQYIEDPGQTSSLNSSWFGYSVVMTTPRNLTIHYNYSTEHYTVVDVVGKPLYKHIYNMPDGMVPPVTPVEGPYSPTFALIGILRMINLGPIYNSGVNPKFAPTFQSLGTNVTEIFECSLEFVAHRYSGIKSIGKDLTINKIDIIPLIPGEYHGTGNDFHLDKAYYATFNTSCKESFNISLPDLGALDSLFTGPRFSGGTFDGNKAPPASGLGVALKDANIGATFEQVARSMTHQLHSGINNSEKREGKSHEHVIVVRVVWPWLSPPVSIHVAALLFLLCTMLYSRKIGIELWKSSAVALLCHRVAKRRGKRKMILHIPRVRDLEHLEELANRTTLSYRK